MVDFVPSYLTSISCLRLCIPSNVVLISNPVHIYPGNFFAGRGRHWSAGAGSITTGLCRPSPAPYKPAGITCWNGFLVAMVTLPAPAGLVASCRPLSAKEVPWIELILCVLATHRRHTGLKLLIHNNGVVFSANRGNT